ncbi:uncharacterized protein LOC125012512 [Mugil cephalus]|uniref:uncharacterized protein LOC125012512 n=1 Tax=Mugil cephalus TaxID=48193 RepID=UPI001FB82C5E|nr:uncharacterized protein LOC125012512 [Mugil cephalus]
METVSSKATVILQHNWPQIFRGETITLRCEIQGGGGTQWTYEWKPDELNKPPTSREYRINGATESDSGGYRCRGRGDDYLTEWSDTIRLTVSAGKPTATLTVNNRVTPVGGSVTLTCSVEPSAGWRFEWFRRVSGSSQAQLIRNNEPGGNVRVSEGGVYHCRGGRGEPVYYTTDSRQVTVMKTVPSKATVILQHNWPQIFRGETITLRCEIQGGGRTQWTYEWKQDELNKPPTSREYRTIRATESDSGGYRCRGRRGYDLTEWSDTIRLTVSAGKPTATLTVNNRVIPVGGSVTLTCSVEPSAGWRFEWFRRVSGSSQAQLIRNNEPGGNIIVSEVGVYQCRGGRGEPVYYTTDSKEVTVTKISSKATVILQPNWTQIFTGETITLRCEIQGGGGTQWTYEWEQDELNKPPTSREYRTIRATESDSGGYRCRGRSYYFTEWSDTIRLTVSAGKPTATLTGNNRVIPVGGSVTLICSVEPSAGWRFYWFRRVSGSSRVQLIRNNEPGENIRVSEGGVYHCRGGRGEPVYYTTDSTEVTVTKISSKATVILQPNWPQIFRGETITLRCEIQGGGGTQWTYEWKQDELNKPPTSREYRINGATESDSGEYKIITATESDSGGYRCRGRRDDYLTEWSDTIRLTVPSDGWMIEWFRRVSGSSQAQLITNNEPGRKIRVSEGGVYHCRGGRGEPVYYTTDSTEVTVTKTPSKATVILQPNWPQIFTGETITLTCEIQGGGGTQWTYEWKPDKLNKPPTSREYRIITATESDSGGYRCRGRRGYYLTEWSDTIRLNVSANQPQASLTVNNRVIPAGGRVTLTCSVKNSAGWRFYWFRRTSEFSRAQTVTSGTSSTSVSVSEGGIYHCRGGRGDQVFFTAESNAVTIMKTAGKPTATLTGNNRVIPVGGSLIRNNEAGGNISVSEGGVYHCRGGRGEQVYYTTNSTEVTVTKISSEATVILQPNWTQIFRGETITLRCEIQGGGGTQWTYEWKPDKLNKPPTSGEYRINGATESDRGRYRCRGRRDDYFTEWSDTIRLTVSGKPQPVLFVSPSWLSPGASVTLSCEVEHPSAGWRFYWYKAVPDLSHKYQYSNYELLPDSINGTEEDSYIIDGQTHTAGYVCRAGRGEPVFYTDYSPPQFVWSGDFNSSVSLRVNPDRVQHFTSDSVSLSCEGNSTEWRVRRFPGDQSWSCSGWRTMTGSTCTELRVRRFPGDQSWSCSGWSTMKDFKCKLSRSHPRNAVYWCESGSGEFSNAVNITVHAAPGAQSSSFPVPLIAGLLCGVILIVLLLLLYRCRPRPKGDADLYDTIKHDTANDGEDVTYTFIKLKNIGKKRTHREPEDRVVYADVNTKGADAVLTTDPYWSPLFTGESVTFICDMKEGGVTDWDYIFYKDGGGFTPYYTHQSYTDDGVLSHCSTWGTMTGSTCNTVFFYHNDKLIQNDTREELIISAVSKSDEGFYKCQSSGKQSPQSWMAVTSGAKTVSRSESSSFLLPLIVGLVCGISLIILLLLLCLYKQSKDSCFVRSQSTNQSSATDHMINQDEGQQSEHPSPLHGDACVYESIKGPEDIENDESRDVTYSLIELKNITKKEKKQKPEESCVYSAVKTGSSPDDGLMYEQVLFHKKGKAKRDKGIPAPATTDETIYSEVKPAKTLGP